MPKNGFTLVELLVVITIMGLVGAYVLSNYNTFGEDKKLKNAVLDVQSLLRQAQTNATSNTKCDSSPAESWQVVYLNNTTLDLRCRKPSIMGYTSYKTLRLDTTNITLSLSSDDPGCLTDSVNDGHITNYPTVTFSPVSGKINLSGSSCSKLEFILTNNKTSSIKTLVLEQGGRINEE